MNIALFQPQIPPNTGNIIRLCANTNSVLHIIHPTGFSWDDKKLLRAGLDYQEFAKIIHYDNWKEFIESSNLDKIKALSTKGKNNAFNCQYNQDDILLFGSETSGLSSEVHNTIPDKQKFRLPMAKTSRSMNLSNSVAIVLFEALRQNNFPGLE